MWIIFLIFSLFIKWEHFFLIKFLNNFMENLLKLWKNCWTSSVKAWKKSTIARSNFGCSWICKIRRKKLISNIHLLELEDIFWLYMIFNAKMKKIIEGFVFMWTRINFLFDNEAISIIINYAIHIALICYLMNLDFSYKHSK